MGNSKSKKVDPWLGFTELHNICKSRNLNGLNQFLTSPKFTEDPNKKTIINAKAASGASPLHVVVSQDSYLCEDYLGPETNENLLHDMTVALIHAGADVKSTDKENQTPLHLAVEAGYSFIAGELLATPGCNVNAQDERGFTPLMIASLNGDAKIVALLLTAKADLDIISADGAVTALVAAIAGNAKNIVRLLLTEYKCKVFVPPRLGEKYATLRQYAFYNSPKRVWQQQDQASIDADREAIIQMLPFQSLIQYVCNSAMAPLRNTNTGKVDEAFEQLTAVASGSMVRTFDLTKTKELADFRDLGHIEGHDASAKAVWSVAFSPAPIVDNNGEIRYLGATSSEDKNNTIRIFDAHTTATIGEIFCENRVNCLAFSACGSTLFAAANEGDIYCFNVKTLEEIGERVSHPLKMTRPGTLSRGSGSQANSGKAGSSSATSPIARSNYNGNNSVASADSSRNISLDIEGFGGESEVQSQQQPGRQVPLQRRGSSSQGRFSGGDDGESLSATTTTTTVRDPELAICQVTVSHDGDFMATTNKREVIIWSLFPHNKNVSPNTVVPPKQEDESKSASTTDDVSITPSTITIVNNKNHEQQQPQHHFNVFLNQPHHETEIPCAAVNVCFSPCNKEIIYTMEIGTINSWHVTSGHRINDIEKSLKPDKPNDYFISMAISCDGRLLACGTASRRICVYDLEKWTLIRSWSIDKADKSAKEKTRGDALPRCLAFLPDTIHYAVLASGSEDGYVRFHVPESQSEGAELVGEPIRLNHSIASMAIAPHTGHCGGVFGCGLQADGGDEDALPRTFSVTFGKPVEVKSATNVLKFEGNAVYLKSGVHSMKFLSHAAATTSKMGNSNVIEVVDQLGNKSEILLDA